MTADDLHATLASLELTQRGAAGLIGVSERSMRYWCSGERPVPEWAQRMLRLMRRTGVRAALEAMRKEAA